MKETKDEKEKTKSIAKKPRTTAKKETSVDTKKEKTVAKKTAKTTTKKETKTEPKATKKAATTVTAKATTKKASTAKKATAKAPAKKAATTKKTAKKTTEKKATTTKKTTVKKAEKDSSKSVATKVTTAAPKKVTSKKVSSKKETPSSKAASIKTFSEYYDLPFRYNQTVIKILAQTPHALFVYWDISDDDRNEMLEKYGEKFFYETRPVLLVHNKTLNSNFEIEVDDFTNSWYLRTPTSNCVFEIELGRKKIVENEKINFKDNSNVLHITKSNTLESPNDHILKETLNTVYFKNVKTNELEKRDVSKYNINNVYGLIDLYNDENGYENNPSSGFKIS